MDAIFVKNYLLTVKKSLNIYEMIMVSNYQLAMSDSGKCHYIVSKIHHPLYEFIFHSGVFHIEFLYPDLVYKFMCDEFSLTLKKDSATFIFMMSRSLYTVNYDFSYSGITLITTPRIWKPKAISEECLQYIAISAF